MKRIVFLLITWSFCASVLFAQSDRGFRSISMEDGLTDNAVTYIHKDHDGFMWFGTFNGISRYDGFTFRNFSIPDRYRRVRIMEETPDGHLWIVADSQIMIFDRLREKYVPVTWTDQLHNSSITGLYVQSDSTAWIISKGYLHKLSFSPLSGTPESNNSGYQILTAKSFERTGVKGNFRRVCGVSDSLLALVTDYSELVLWNWQRETVHKTLVWNDNAYLEPYHIMADSSYVWVSTTGGGAVGYHLSDGTFSIYNQHTYPNIRHNNVYQVAPMNDGYYVAATYQGYLILHPKTRQAPLVYDYDTSPELRLLDTKMLSAFYDHGILWIGTRGGGVIKSSNLSTFYHQAFGPSIERIRQVDQDKNGYLWAASLDRGVKKSLKPFNPLEEPLFTYVDLPSGSYLSLCIDKQGIIWCGTTTGTVYAYNPTTKSKKTYNLGVDCQVESCFLEGDRVWACTTKGLFLIDPLVETPQQFIPNYWVRKMVPTKQPNLYYLATENGLVKLQTSTGSPSFSIKDYEFIAQIEARGAISLHASGNGLLYIGYRDGLGVLDIQADTITHFYNTRNGLCNNHIGCITEDKNGLIWFGSNSAITMMNPKLGLFYHYYIAGNTHTVTTLGDQLLFADYRSFTWLNPETFHQENNSTRKAWITGLKIGNKEMHVNDTINGQLILSQTVDKTESLNLSYKNSRFSFSFSSLRFDESPHFFLYRLFPYETEWSNNKEGEWIFYGDVPSGRYQLQVVPASSDTAVLNPENITKLDVRIRPHWTRQVWFIILFFLFVISAITLIIRFFLQQQRKQIREQSIIQDLLLIYKEKAPDLFGNASNSLLLVDFINKDDTLKKLFDGILTVYFTHDEKDALEKVHQFKPSTILVHSHIGHAKALDFCTQCKQDPLTAPTPILLLSDSTPSSEDVVRLHKSIDDIISTPIPNSLLLTKVFTFIHRQQHLKRFYVKSLIPSSSFEKSVGHGKLIQQIVEIVEKNISDSNFNIEMLASQLHMSTASLYRHIKKDSDLTISEIIRSVRMNKSAVMLLEKRHSIQEIAFLTGYSDIKTFRKHFYQQFSILPSKFADVMLPPEEAAPEGE